MAEGKKLHKLYACYANWECGNWSNCYAIVKTAKKCLYIWKQNVHMFRVLKKLKTIFSIFFAHACIKFIYLQCLIMFKLELWACHEFHSLLYFYWKLFRPLSSWCFCLVLILCVLLFFRLLKVNFFVIFHKIYFLYNEIEIYVKNYNFLTFIKVFSR